MCMNMRSAVRRPPRAHWLLLWFPLLVAGIVLLSWREVFAQMWGVHIGWVQTLAWVVGTVGIAGTVIWFDENNEVLSDNGASMLLFGGTLVAIIVAISRESYVGPLESISVMRAVFWSAVAAGAFGFYYKGQSTKPTRQF